MANEFRKEIDSLGEVNVPADKLWGAQTQRSLEHFSIAGDLMPRGDGWVLRHIKKSSRNREFPARPVDRGPPGLDSQSV